jgi:hypothetical protein
MSLIHLEFSPFAQHLASRYSYLPKGMMAVEVVLDYNIVLYNFLAIDHHDTV